MDAIAKEIRGCLGFCRMMFSSFILHTIVVQHVKINSVDPASHNRSFRVHDFPIMCFHSVNDYFQIKKEAAVRTELAETITSAVIFIVYRRIHHNVNIERTCLLYYSKTHSILTLTL